MDISNFKLLYEEISGLDVLVAGFDFKPTLNSEFWKKDNALRPEARVR